MRRKYVYSVLAGLLCFCVPAAVKAFSEDAGKALYCGDSENPVCALYQVCRPILDKYPEAEITEKGKDCTLTIESRQLIIRRKRTGGATGYFFYAHRAPEVKKAS